VSLRMCSRFVSYRFGPNNESATFLAFCLQNDFFADWSWMTAEMKSLFLPRLFDFTCRTMCWELSSSANFVMSSREFSCVHLFLTNPTVGNRALQSYMASIRLGSFLHRRFQRNLSPLLHKSSKQIPFLTRWEY
jgi:hypothetical protein